MDLSSLKACGLGSSSLKLTILDPSGEEFNNQPVLISDESGGEFNNQPWYFAVLLVILGYQ